MRKTNQSRIPGRGNPYSAHSSRCVSPTKIFWKRSFSLAFFLPIVVFSMTCILLILFKYCIDSRNSSLPIRSLCLGTKQFACRLFTCARICASDWLNLSHYLCTTVSWKTLIFRLIFASLSTCSSTRHVAKHLFLSQLLSLLCSIADCAFLPLLPTLSRFLVRSSLSHVCPANFVVP